MSGATLTPDARRAKTVEMIARLQELFPVGATLTVADKAYTVAGFTKYSATLKGARGKEYSVTPCPGAQIVGYPDALAYAICWVSGLQSRSQRFCIDADRKCYDL